MELNDNDFSRQNLAVDYQQLVGMRTEVESRDQSFISVGHPLG